jgi:tripeptidyl-peptidase-1
MLATLPALLVLGVCLAAASPPTGWERVPAGEANIGGNGALQMPVAFALKLSAKAIGELERTFAQVSDPAHERYGRHLSKAQLEQLLSSDETAACRTVVEAWLRSSLAASEVVRLGVDGLHTTASHADVEAAFGVSPLLPYRRRTSGPIVFRSPATRLNMPENVDSCVDVVSGVLSSELSEVAHEVAVTAGKKPSTWPATLAELYGLPANVPNGTGSRQATANFIGQYYAPSDLDAFFTKYAPGLVDHDTIELVGPGINDPEDPGSEASLDLQCACTQDLRLWSCRTKLSWS